MTQLHIEGAVASPQAFGLEDLVQLPDQVEDIS